MPITFLDNLQLSQNQLLGARLQLVPNDSDITSPVSGQIIYNSGSNIFKYYNGTDWIDPAADTSKWEAAIFGGATGPFTVETGDTLQFKPSSPIAINLSGSNGAPNYTVALENSGVSANTYTNATITVDSKGIISSASSGNAGATYTLPTSLASANTGRITLTGSDGTTDTVNFAGTTNEIQVTQPTSGVLSFGLPDDVTIADDLTVAGELTVQGTGQSSFAGKVTGITPTASGDLATKGYVDTSVAGGLNVKGGFNANTGVTAVAGTNLYTNTALAIGDYYVVTVAGNFFGQASTPLTIGDSVLVQTAAASGSGDIDDFAVIQSDTDLATANTVGLASFPTSGGLTVSGGAVSITGLGSAGTGGASATKTTGVTINTRGQVTGFTSTNISIPSSQISNFNTSTDARITAREFSGTSSSGTTHTFNHNLNSFDVMVQIYNNAISTQDTVYAETVRTSVNQVVVTTASSANIRCLIQKIG